MFKTLTLAAAAALLASASGAATLIYDHGFEGLNGMGFFYNGGGAPLYSSGNSSIRGTALGIENGSTFDHPYSRSAIEGERLVVSGVNGQGVAYIDMSSIFLSYGTNVGGYRVTFDVDSSGNLDTDDVVSAWWSHGTGAYFGVGGPTSFEGGSETDVVWRGTDSAATIDLLIPVTPTHYYLDLAIGATAAGEGQEIYVDNLAIYTMGAEELEAEAAARLAAAAVEVAPVPLPSSALLMLGGLGGLAMMRRRR